MGQSGPKWSILGGPFSDASLPWLLGGGSCFLFVMVGIVVNNYDMEGCTCHGTALTHICDRQDWGISGLQAKHCHLEGSRRSFHPQHSN